MKRSQIPRILLFFFVFFLAINFSFCHADNAHDDLQQEKQLIKDPHQITLENQPNKLLANSQDDGWLWLRVNWFWFGPILTFILGLILRPTTILAVDYFQRKRKRVIFREKELPIYCQMLIDVKKKFVAIDNRSDFEGNCNFLLETKNELEKFDVNLIDYDPDYYSKIKNLIKNIDKLILYSTNPYDALGTKKDFLRENFKNIGHQSGEIINNEISLDAKEATIAIQKFISTSCKQDFK